MLRRADALYKFTLGATDGEIGKVKDFYFDDQFWTVRYLVADTGNWLQHRLVLISPLALVSVDEEHEVIATNLSKKQIEDSPPATSDKPISRQFEVDYYRYYGWPAYWQGPFKPYPKAQSPEEASWNAHLRSVRDVDGFGVSTLDGDIGHIVDFLIDDKDWTIRYLEVDTRNWWPSKHVLMSPQWIGPVTWDDRKVHVDITREKIETAPEYLHRAPIYREYEMELFRHYNREGYWTDV